MLIFGYQTIHRHWNYRTVRAAESIGTGIMTGARSNNFQLCIFCVFLQYVRLTPGVIILGMYSVFQAMVSVQKTSMANVPKMQEQFQLMQEKMAVAMQLAALTEVSMLFILLINFRWVYVLVYTNWLKQRLNCADDVVFRVKFTKGTVQSNHFLAWKTLGGLVEPVLKMVPILRTPISWVQAWFLPRPIRPRYAPAPAPAPGAAPKVPSWNKPKPKPEDDKSKPDEKS
jgi:hypothetical protein